MSLQTQQEKEYLTFILGSKRYGIPLEKIEQVVLLRSNVVPLPRAPPFLVGAVQVQERLVPLVDMEIYLELKPRAEDRFELTSNAIIVKLPKTTFAWFCRDLPKKVESEGIEKREEKEEVPENWIIGEVKSQPPFTVLDPEKVWADILQGRKFHKEE